ncbi:Ig-like domain repeat protein [Methanobrevibacter sp.]|uniref:Ig-like domain repeat protein n=1 Tax=Methanobrevibacter sp. TaxID=66852 RepID=UPI00388F0DD5
MIISVSAVSAAEDASDLGAADDDALSISNTDVAIADGVKNFTDLSTDVAAAGNVVLTSDYIRNESETVVTIDRIGTIDGQGHTIDADGKGGIFIVNSAGTLTLKNMILKNAVWNSQISEHGGAIYTESGSTLILDNVTFYNNFNYDNRAITAHGDLTVNNCIFDIAGETAHGGIVSYGKLSLDNNAYNGTLYFATLMAGSLTSESTIYVEASVDPATNFKEINYRTSRIVDDNNNIVEVEYGVGTWAVTFNDVAVTTTPTWEAGNVSGKANAKSYGEQRVEITNTALAAADVVSATVNIAPVKQDTVLTLTFAPGTPKWNDNVNLTITATPFHDDDLGDLYATGDVNISITPGGIKETLTFNKTGVATYVIENAATGSYSVLIQYGGDDNFNAATKNDQPAFEVAAKTIVITDKNITVDQTKIGEQTISIALPSDAAGYITAKIGSDTYIQSTHVTGSASFDANLQPGSYDLEITFISDGNYANYADTVPFTVPKLTTTIDIAVENITYGNNATFTITLNKDVGNASVSVVKVGDADNFETVALTNGTATINKGKLDAADWIITVKALDDKYEECTTNTTFKVSQAVPEMTIVVGQVELFKDIKVNVTVKDYEGNVELWFDSNLVGTVAVSNGVAEFTIPAAYNDEAGDWTLYAYFTPTDLTNIEEKEINKTITIAKVTPQINVTLTYGVALVNREVDLDVYLSNHGTGLGPNGVLVITMNGETIATGTLTDGEDNGLVIPADKITALGKYTINVAYLGDNYNYNPNSTDFTFEAEKWPVYLRIKDIDNATLGQNTTIELGAYQPYYLADVSFPVNFTIAIKDAKNVTVKEIPISLINSPTEPSKLNVTLGVGTYTAVLSYPGDDVSFANSTTSNAFNVKGAVKSLTIEAMGADYPDNATAVVTADVDGDYNVTIIETGDVYTVHVVDGTGSVTFDVLAPGPYTATVKSIMELYPSETNQTTFTIDKGLVVATFTVANVDYPTKGIAYVTANVDGKYQIRSESSADVFDVTVVNGTGNVTFTEMLPGTYTLALWGIVAENDNYTNSKVDTLDFTVNKGTVDVNLTVDDVSYPNKPVVILNATVGGAYTITVLNGTTVINTYPVTLNAGEAKETTITDDLLPGTYTIDVAATIDYYDPVKLNKTFEVTKGLLEYSIAATNITYDGTAISQVTLTATVKGTEATTKKGYAIYLGDATSPLAYINGDDTDKTVDLPLLGAGTYTIKVVPIESDPAFIYYDLSATPFNTTTFEVAKGTTTFDISVSNVEYPANVTVHIVNSNINGTYIVSVGDATQEVFVNSSDVAVDFEGLPINAYLVTVTSKNANYTEVTEQANVVVTYGPVHPTVANVVVPYLADAVVVVESDTDGEYIVTVAEKDYTVNVVNGKGNVTLDVLPIGDYSVKLTANIKDYMPYLNPNIATVKINQAKVNLTIEVTNVTYPENATATVSANVSGTYTIKVGTQEFNVTIETTPGFMASVTQTLNMLGYGTYTATVDKAVLDGNFTVDEAQYVFNVAKATPVINIDVKDTYSVYDNVTIVVTVPYGTGTVKISSDILAEQELPLVNETANVTIPKVTAFGEHVITVVLNDPNFNGGLEQATFNVTKITPVINVAFNNASYKDDAKVNVTFGNLNDEATITGTLIISDVGSVTVDGDKNYTFDLGSNLPAGEYTLNVTYTGNSIYAGVTDVITITIAKLTPFVNVTAVTGGTYPDNATVTFISDAAGNFTIDIVDASGVVVKSIDVGAVAANNATTVAIVGLDGGKYTAKVNYLENENYTGVTNTSDVFQIAKAVTTIEANALPVAYPNVATVVVKAGQAGTYTIKVAKGGIMYYNTTGDLVAGENTIALIALPAGDYTFTVEYDSNDYVADPATGNLTVAKGLPTITIVGNDATYPEAASVTVTSNADGAYTIIMGTLPVTEGIFTAGEPVVVPLGVLGAGVHDIAVAYGGNDNFDKTTVMGNVTVAQGTPVITLTVNTQTIGEDATLTITIPYATGDSVSLNTNISVPLVDGVGTYNIGVLEATDYTFTAVYDGDANLTFGQNTIAFTVAKLPSNLVVKTNNITLGEVANVIVTIDNKATLAVGIYVDGVYVASAEVTNGAAIIPVADIPAGDHNITVVYGGSAIYSEDAQTAAINVRVPVYVISENKNIAVVYSGTATYKVLVTKDGVPAAGETVTIVINGATKKVTTDAEGYATYAFKTTKLAPKSYTITASCGDAKVKNTVKVTHVLKVANKAVKKSSTVTKVKVALKQVDGKYLAKKTIKIKFRGTTYKVTTNAKGIGYWKVTKAMVSKLKVGSKYTYKATYGKDAVSKKLVIKK